MLILAWISLVLCLLLTIQCAVVAAFVARVIRHRRPIAEQTRQPKAAVVLALRGPDPFLDECMQRLLAQQYQDFTIFLVVDSDQDPVLQDIQRVLEKNSPSNVVVSILENPYLTCTLKCSALIQAVRSLDDSYEVVAFLDGDALPHPTWLLELVAPLADPKVGVAYGNRWYVPTHSGWGTCVRYCWNVGAVIQVWLNKIIWAGSMAMRTDTIDKIALPRAWSTALSVDATVHRQLRKHDYEVRFVPSVIMANREAISLPRFNDWMQRQMIASKSCGTSWRLVGFHALSLAANQLFTLGVLIAGLLMGDALVMTLAGLGLALYWGSSLLSIMATEAAIRRVAQRNGEVIKWQTWVGMMVFPAMLLTQFVYPIALARAVLRRRVSWRGVEYDVQGVDKVLMKKYRPYRDLQQSPAAESVV